MELPSSSEIDDTSGEFSEIEIGFVRGVLGRARGFGKARRGTGRRCGRGLRGTGGNLERELRGLD